MADDSAAAAAKDKGNKAFSAGDYDAAVAAFTEAIANAPTDHVLYSNRSAASAKSADFKNALLDANKCIEIKPDWAKGHSRRGAAYVGLKNWPSAQAAYEKAVELDPTSAAAKQSLESVKLARDPTARAAAAKAASGGGPPTSSVGASLSLIIVVTGALYLLPLPQRYSIMIYRTCLINILMLFVLNLYGSFPLKMSTLVDPVFKARQESQAFMLCLFMLLTPPLPFALMPFLATSLLTVCYAYKDAAAALPFVGAMVGPRMAFFTTEEGAFQLRSFGAVSEVVVAAMSPLLCIVQGARAAILGFFYFQYVVRRTRSNELTRTACKHFDERILSLLSHRYVPAPLKMLYQRAKVLVDKLAQYTVK